MNDTASVVGNEAGVETQRGAEGHDSGREERDKSDLISFDVARVSVTCFIIFHIFAVVMWNLPDTPLQQGAVGLVKAYMMFTGTWQSWCMFSPNPVDVDTYLGATIHYQDGSSREYTFPRICKLGIASKYRQERWRKFIENTQSVDNADDWPYLARYAALVNNPNPTTNPPKSVDLYRFSRFIVDNGGPEPEYLKAKMMTEDVIAMPSKGPLHLGG